MEHQPLASVSDFPSPRLPALRSAVAHQVLLPDPDPDLRLPTRAYRGGPVRRPTARRTGAAARGFCPGTHRAPRAPHPARRTPARLAYHWVRAHDPAPALPAAVEAGLSPRRQRFRRRAAHFETVLELWDQVAEAGPPPGLDRASVLRHAAESAYLAGDPISAITLTRAALGDEDETADPVRAGLLHALLGGYSRRPAARTRQRNTRPPYGWCQRFRLSRAGPGVRRLRRGADRSRSLPGSPELSEEAITIAQEVRARAGRRRP